MSCLSGCRAARRVVNSSEGGRKSTAAFRGCAEGFGAGRVSARGLKMGRFWRYHSAHTRVAGHGAKRVGRCY